MNIYILSLIIIIADSKKMRKLLTIPSKEEKNKFIIYN